MRSRAAFILSLAVLAPLLAFAIAWCVAPPILNTDSATGFLAWENMRAGGPWNSVVGPDPANIARDRADFISWWSPGQYVVPGLFKEFTGTWCRAALVTNGLSLLTGALGVWLLARRLSLGPENAALACLLTTVAGGALHGFGMFWGGDILLLAAAPFVYLAALRTRELPPTIGATCFFLACITALFCKHGGVLVIAGALLFLALESWRERGIRLALDSRLLAAAAAAAMAYVCSQALWVRGGPTAGAAGQVEHAAPAAIGLALNGPWFSLTGAGSLCYWLFQKINPGASAGQHPFSGWLMPPGIAALALVAWLGLRRDSALPWRLAAAAWIATSGLMGILYLRGASISLEERHFRPAVPPLALALACTAIPASGRRSIASKCALALALGALVLGGVAHMRRVELLTRLPKGDITGFAQPDMPSDARAAVDRLLPAEAILVLTSPSHAIEFRDRRFLATDAFARTKDELARWRFSGAKSLMIAVAAPENFDTDGRGATLRAAFHDIEPAAWRRHEAAGWSLWSVSGDSLQSGP